MVQIYLVLTVILWASAFVGIRHAVKEYHPFELALLRYMVASFTLLIFAVIKKIQLPDPKDSMRLFFTGIIGISVYNITLNYGELTTTAGEACFIVNMAPLFTVLMGVLFLKEKIGFNFTVGLIISFAGVSLIAFSFTGHLTFKTGSLFIIAAAVAHALYFILQKPLLRKYTPMEVTCYCMWSGTIAMVPFGYGFFEKMTVVDPQYTVVVMYLGIFPAAIAYLCWAAVLSNMDASKAASYLYAVPAVVIIMGLVFLNELPPPISILGGVIAIIGVILANKPQKARAAGVIRQCVEKPKTGYI